MLVLRFSARMQARRGARSLRAYFVTRSHEAERVFELERARAVVLERARPTSTSTEIVGVPFHSRVLVRIPLGRRTDPPFSDHVPLSQNPKETPFPPPYPRSEITSEEAE